MPRLFPLLAPFHPIVAPSVPDAPAEDDLALGWECANPALQFESWEPAPSAAEPAGPLY